MKKPERIYKCSICGSIEHNSLRHFEKTSKLCKKCGRELNITDFTTKGVSHQGTYKYRSSTCKECSKNKTAYNYRKDVHTRLMFLLGGVRSRVRIGNLAFDLELEWLEELYAKQEGLCYCWFINAMKHDLGDESFINLCKTITRYSRGVR